MHLSTIFLLFAVRFLWSSSGPGFCLLSPASTIPFDVVTDLIHGVDMTTGSWCPVLLWSSVFLFLDGSTFLTFPVLVLLQFLRFLVNTKSHF